MAPTALGARDVPPETRAEIDRLVEQRRQAILAQPDAPHITIDPGF